MFDYYLFYTYLNLCIDINSNGLLHVHCFYYTFADIPQVKESYLGFDNPEELQDWFSN